MNGKLTRFGLGYRYTPEGAPITLAFSRVADKSSEFPAEVAVYNSHTRDAVITRQVNLKASLTQGSMAGLIKELDELSRLNGGAGVDWKAMLREAAESVIASHRAGHPVQAIQGEMQRPPPPAWLSQGLLLKNKPNCWLGAASTGKSTLAKAITAYYAAGYRFCDRPMEQGVPLYLDWEDDRDSFLRVVIDVCRNLGVWPMPLMLWRDMHGYRLRDQIEMIGEIVDRYHVGLLVLDAVAAAGGGAGEYLGWEDIALEMERCLGSLPPVTVLALDHVTGEELKQGQRATVPRKARGAVRKYEYLRNQWTLVTDEAARYIGRHVVNWYHTKNSVGVEERPGFATEVLHRESEISIVVRPIQDYVPTETVQGDTDQTKTSELLRSLGETWRSPRELAIQVDGKVPARGRTESVRNLLERAVSRGLAVRDQGSPVRYSCRQPAEQGVLIPFRGGAS